MLKSGWIVIDKPLYLTSTQVGAIVRKTLGIRKIGHVGTLDPLATGVLTLALEEATKVIPYYTVSTKTYDFEITWGESRSTDDKEGEVLETSSFRPSIKEIASVLYKFKGCIDQIPPVFSAVKINGQRSYKRARLGEDVKPKVRKVQIDSLEIIQQVNESQCQFRVRCGSGTYIRSLGRDMAIELGTLGHISYLRRIQDGKFKIEDTISLEKLKEIAHKGEVYQYIKPIESVLDDIPAVPVSVSDIEKIQHGQKIPSQKGITQPLVLLCGTDNHPVGIAAFEEGCWQPKRIFHKK